MVSVAANEHARLIRLQCAITIIGAALAYLLVTPQAAKSLAFGSCVPLVSTLFLAWRLGQSQRENAGAEKILRQAYRTAMERMAGTILMLAAGFKVLQLTPLWMLAGFLAGQAAWLLLPVLARVKSGQD